MKQNTLLLLLASFLLWNCTRDDICEPEVQKTPMLIVKFYNANMQDSLKTVENFTVFADTISENLFPPEDTDSIAIPLKVTDTLTEFAFATIQEDTTLVEKIDFLSVTYQLEDEYINRACGFRTNYYELDIQLQPQPLNSWIDSIEIQTDSITAHNQNETHLHIFH